MKSVGFGFFCVSPYRVGPGLRTLPSSPFFLFSLSVAQPRLSSPLGGWAFALRFPLFGSRKRLPTGGTRGWPPRTSLPSRHLSFLLGSTNHTTPTLCSGGGWRGSEVRISLGVVQMDEEACGLDVALI